MTFHVGQKVVCIDDRCTGKYLPFGWCTDGTGLHGLKRGRVYMIRDLCSFEGVLTCRLVEIIRPIEMATGEESCFARARFRPLKQTKTDISIFTSMLTPNKERV